jgi:hypothetical protein
MRLAALLLAVPATCAMAAPPGGMRPGLWETTIQSSMAGGKPHSMRSCMTAAQLEDPKGAMPKMQDKGMKCDQLDYKINGATVSWKMRCTGEMPMEGTGQMTAGPDSYTGKIDMSMKMQGQTMNISQTMSGKRLGDCPAK